MKVTGIRMRGLERGKMKEQQFFFRPNPSVEKDR